MKSLLVLFFGVVIFLQTQGQDVNIRTTKVEYKLDETITLIFEINASVDSVSKLKTENFIIIGAPQKSQYSSTINGNTNYSYKITYTIKAITPGNLRISSPIFYLNNGEEKNESIVLKISGDNLTKEEIDKINFDNFKDNSIKPNGTLRYIVSEDLGFIEEFDGSLWKFKRRLTKKEISKLRK